MDKYNHFSYGQMLSEKLRPITGYYRATEQDEIDDLTERLSSASGTLLIAIDGTESSFLFEPSNLMEQPYYLFAIVAQVESGNPESLIQETQYCKEIAKQIIARMMLDNEDYLNGLTNLAPESFRIKGFGPIGENFFGVLLGFQLEQSMPYSLDVNLWRD